MRYSNGLPTPVTARERFESLDVLRGIGVLGILVMNIYAFAMPFAAYMNPYAMGGLELHNLGTWFVTHVVFDQKFLSVFSMLFGAGMILMMDRAGARGAPFGPIYYRRQIWLLLIGALHGYLIWVGDILFGYALTGMIIYVFRKRSPRALLLTGCLLLPVASLLMYGGGVYMEDLRAEATEYAAITKAGETLTDDQQAKLDEWSETRAFIAPGEQEIEADLSAYRSDYATIVRHRAPVVADLQTSGFLFFIVWRVGGIMLIGMALMKLGVLTAERSLSFYRNLTFAGYLVGLPLTLFSAWNLNAHDFEPLYTLRVGGLANYYGSILVALGHVGVVMLIIKTAVLKGLMARFAAVGRMALSNYLAHSVFLTTIFYGYGLNLYGHVPRLWQMAFVLGLISLQLLWSRWWLARFQFGPVEWLWRSLTYWQRQPMRNPS